jgi:hypothetical protein
MVLLVPGTIERPVAPGTEGSLYGLTAAPGPATMLAEGETEAVDWGRLAHPARPRAMPPAVKEAVILFITVFLFDQLRRQHWGDHQTSEWCDRRSQIAMLPIAA